MAVMYTKLTVVDPSKSMEEKRVAETVKDNTEISKVSQLFLCSSKSFLNFRLSINRVVINKTCILSTHSDIF